MKKTFLVLILLLAIAIGFNACRQTYEYGPIISFRTKMSRITGKWKLVSMEGVPRLHPEKDQNKELTKEKISDGVYKAKFTNFQDDYCSFSPPTRGEALFTADGTWKFYSGAFFGGCSIGEYLDENEGLDISINESSNIKVEERWKILRLTNKELKIRNNVCVDDFCDFYWNVRTLTFKKE